MVDVYLFSGFLGSGKTSMMTDVIRQLKEQNIKPAIIMNELGKLNFDSQAVEEDVPLKEMLNGCICCSGSEKTEAQIQTLLAESEFDVLIIETTGAAHPVEALDAVYSPLFADQLNIKGIVTVADSKRWLERNQLSPQVRSLFLEQIRHAHLILANKSDLLTEEERAKVTFEIQSLNPHAQLLQTTNGRVPLKYLQSLHATARPNNIESAPISHLHLSSRLVTFTEPVEQEVFEAWLRTIPSTIYRMKGYVPIKGMKNPMLFQYAYGLTQWMPEYMQMPPNIVIIGENVNELEVVGTL
ncbi:CobW family GTP-binding protein [Viridibacillus sp. FSL R5-0477]|uniref:Putative GTPase (G3E family)-like protein n=1 Tax=Viridibacillus arenosi FSL R5-213 TaxID=1227360 RepID=W4EK11_9BACL|nr:MULTISPECIES: CobW family GTP-binding protein [Viridibacillus]ETT80895.1 putative GTPase (G3E family)-like protein [Viridibacillus arenosi FSL R5-213]OMC84197.1 cobalamin biosynthesis protein [Viridibacillus sp. FSL H8-0123]OMC89229.1 cobalamin biosynthesis protein [Viridibacillus sp. FSL H7-0596]OMC93666.1 cobalamin biosynthesis protein [Viridibacillus arenosi]